MSYTDLCDKCMVVSKHMKRGCGQITNLTLFFKAFKKVNETYCASMMKVLESLQVEVQDDSSTLEIALDSIYTTLKGTVTKLQDLSRNMQIEIIEPLDLFSDHYNETITPFMSSSEILYKHLTKSKENMIKSRHKYYQSSASAEKLLQSDEKASKANQNLRNQVQKASDDYLKAIESVNKLTEEFDKSVPENMKTLQQNEESRIHFLRSIFEKFIKSLSKTEEKSKFDKVLGLLNNINSDIDIQVFVDTHKGKYKGGIKEEFISYQKWRDRRKELNEVEIRDGSENFEEEIDKAVLYVLGNDEDSDSSFSEVETEEPDHGKISESFKFESFRVYFLDLLDSNRHRSSLTQGKMQMLAAYFKSLLTSLVVDEDRDNYTFCKVVSLLHAFYTGNKKREYLSQMLSSHSIWAETLRWVEAIEHSISIKVAHDKESLKNIPKIPGKKKGLFGALKKIANKFPSVFQKETLGEENEKTAAFIIMTQFSSYMSYLSVPLDLCNSIILLCSQRANLDKNRTCTLLAELEASGRTNFKSLKPIEESLRAREKERKKYKSLVPIGLSLPFLSPSECTPLLSINKSWRSCLLFPILRKCILYWKLPEKNLKMLRNFTWNKLLAAHMREIDYFAFLNKIKLAAKDDIEEVIALDVARSYQNSEIVPSESLKNVLSVYAFYNKGVGYCQGMNYIAGTILFHYRNEEASLKVMVALIEKFHMSDLFENDLPKLKMFFYQLDRLISIRLPDLHEQFKQLSVTSGHFCSPWFITLFASHLQSKPEILASIWDLFIFDGWKTVFKAAIVILDKIRKNMPNARFEDLMFALASIQGNNPVVQVFDDSFIPEVVKADVSNDLLRELEAEYVHLKERAEKYTKNN